MLSVPIGNSEDLTLRGKKTLEEKTLFFVEDTRPFFNLLRSQGIESGEKKVYSFHEHSKDSRLQFAKKLFEKLMLLPLNHLMNMVFYSKNKHHPDN